MIELTLDGTAKDRVAVMRSEIAAIIELPTGCRLFLKNGCRVDVLNTYDDLAKAVQLQ